MTTEHEALDLAKIITTANAANFKQDAARVLRTQHALIVQMLRALEKCRFDSLNMPVMDFNEICSAYAEGTKYLKGPKT